MIRHAEHMDSGKRRNALGRALKGYAALTRLRYTLDSAFPQLGEKWIQPEERNVASSRRFVRDTTIDRNTAKGIPETAGLEVKRNALSLFHLVLRA